MNTAVNQNKDEAIEKLARFGLSAKGAVYLILGVLTAMAAFNVGGQKAGQGDVLKFIYGQPFGKVLLSILAIGLIGYVIWRFVQAFRDPENEGNDKKNIAKRAGYAGSGIIYAFLAYEAIKLIFQNGSSGSGGGNKQIVSTLLEQPFGQILVGIVAVGLFIKAGTQIYKAVSGKFAKKIKSTDLEPRIQNMVMKAGKVGFIARGVVAGIIGFLFLKAAIQANPNQAGGTESAFSFIQGNAYGSILLGIVAIGLACYGVFMIIKARYRVMPSNM